MENLENNNVETSMVDSTIEDTTKKENVAATENKEKTFTQEDIDKIIARTIARERKKAEEEREEAAKVAKMTAEEKAKHEFEQEKKRFEEERALYLKDKTKMTLERKLMENELDVNLADFLIAEDEDTSLDNLNKFKEIFNSCLEKAVAKRLKGETPKTGGFSNKDEGITKEQFKKLSILERQKIYESDRELFERLSK